MQDVHKRVVHFQGKVGEPSLKTVDPQFFWSEGDFESLEFQNKAAKSGGWAAEMIQFDLRIISSNWVLIKIAN